MQTVLLIDDDVVLVEMLKEYIEQENFAVLTAHDGMAGAQMLTQHAVDIVVLDVMMPKLNGIETLKVIRQHSNLPVIMLTAKGDNTDRIIGLELGADDYVPKPSSPREIVARIRAILRRVKPSEAPNMHGEIMRIGALSMWPAERRVTWADTPVVLTSTEYSLLEILAKNAGQVVTKQELSIQALGRPLARFDRSIDVHLSSIRHKLGLLPDGRHCIQTVFRSGYQLIKH
ncbi:MAG TPA: response regulator transcription factor [Methylotenera sp.]|nr:response regulator transcription factor [Methylotenera sp.]HPH04390.1 response regulator transcription factor [Methylotenera sp.]HPM99944.1 response regulator transcription factor [Methylotenera sp.]